MIDRLIWLHAYHVICDRQPLVLYTIIYIYISLHYLGEVTVARSKAMDAAAKFRVSYLFTKIATLRHNMEFAKTGSVQISLPTR